MSSDPSVKVPGPEIADADVKVPTIETPALATSTQVTVQAPHDESVSPPAENAALSAAEPTAAVAQPVSTPLSLASARAIAGLKTRQPAEFPKTLLKMMNPETGVTAQALFRHPPIVAGQSLDEYFDLVEAVLLDYRPYSYRDLALAKQIVDEEWKVMTFGPVQTDLLNAAIGSGLVDQIADLDEGPSKGRPHRMRTLRRIVFGGITGDPAMIGLLEKELGVGCLGLNVYSARHIVDDVRAHIFVDNTMNAALRSRNSAIQQLEKLAESRFQRMTLQKPTAEDIRALQSNLGLEEYVRLSITRTRFAKEDSTEGAPAADQAGSGAQSQAIDPAGTTEQK
jgi:hypothetical protein